MPESQLSIGCLIVAENSMRNEEPGSARERELVQFISAVDSLILMSSSTHFLTEIWLDQLARAGSMGSSTDPDWRAVSLAASETLARILLESQLRKPRA